MKLSFLEKAFVGSTWRVNLLRKYEASEVLARLPLLTGSSCLEIGCGNGAGALLIKHYTGCNTLVSVDIDRDSIEKARRFVAGSPDWAKHIPRDGITFTEGNATDLPFGDDSFDAAFHFFVLDHIPEWKKALTEVYRVLKPGGVYSFEDALLPDSPFLMHTYFGHVPLNENILRDSIQDTGFTVERMTVKSNGFRRCFVICRKNGSTDRY